MSILIVRPNREIQIANNSFQKTKRESYHMGNKIPVVSFRLRGTEIIVNRISRDKLLQPNKRYALIENCLQEGKKEMWRPCGIFRLPNDLPLQRTNDYIHDIIKVAVYYPENTYYLQDKDIAQLGLIQIILENDPDAKEIELNIGETAFQLCLSKNIEINLDINDEKNRDQIEKLFHNLAYLDCKYLEEFIQKIAEKIIIQIRETHAQKVTNFFRQNLSRLFRSGFHHIANNPNVGLEFFQTETDEIEELVYFLSQNPNIPVDFFQRYINYVDWEALSRNPNIPEEFFQQHLDKVDWYYLSANSGISAEFFHRHLDRIDWKMLSSNPNIPTEFFQQHLDKIDWQFLSANSNISLKFLQQHLDKIDWNVLSSNSNIPFSFFQENSELVNWEILSGNPNITVQFLHNDKNLEKIDWWFLSTNPGVPAEFFQLHLDKVDWGELSGNPGISVEFFKDEKNLEKADWWFLSSNPNIPAEFFQQHLDKVNWKRLSDNPGISLEFLRQHSRQIDWPMLFGNRFLYDSNALISVIKKSNLFSSFQNVWKRKAIKFLRKESFNEDF